MVDAYTALVASLRADAGVSAGALARITRAIAIGDGDATRMKLGDDLGLSAGTVSKAVEKLIASGLVRGVQSSSSGRGRPSMGLRLADDGYVCLGVRLSDKGGRVSELSGTISTLDGRALFFSEPVRVTPVGPRGGPDLVDQVEDFVRATLLRQVELLDRSVLGLGLELGGHIQDGIVRRSTNDPSLDGLELGPELGRRFPFPVVVENDVTALAVLEHLFAGITGRRDAGQALAVVGVFHEGIGAGVVSAAGVWRGAHGLASEIGHIPVAIDAIEEGCRVAASGTKEPPSTISTARRCRCGRTGCLEALATPSALRQRCLAAEGPDPMLQPELEDLEPKVAAMLGRVFAEGGAGLGQALATFVNLVDPGRILLLLDPSLDPDRGGPLQARFHEAVREELLRVYSTEPLRALEICYFSSDDYRRLHAKAGAAVVLEKLLCDLDSSGASERLTA